MLTAGHPRTHQAYELVNRIAVITELILVWSGLVSKFGPPGPREKLEVKLVWVCQTSFWGGGGSLGPGAPGGGPELPSCVHSPDKRRSPTFGGLSR